MDSLPQILRRASLALFRFENLVVTSDPKSGWQMTWAKALQELSQEGVLTSTEVNLAFFGGLGSGQGDRLSPVLPLVM